MSEVDSGIRDTTSAYIIAHLRVWVSRMNLEPPHLLPSQGLDTPHITTSQGFQPTMSTPYSRHLTYHGYSLLRVSSYQNLELPHINMALNTGILSWFKMPLQFLLERFSGSLILFLI